jgi:hypothetical protein
LAAEVDQTMAAGRTFVFVDVGANVGLFSRYAASYAGVNAFMPLIREPGNVTRLRFSVTQIRVPLFAHTDASSALRWPPMPRHGRNTKSGQ